MAKDTKETKKPEKKEKYDVEDVIVIEDKKKGDDFDLGREELDAGNDDDELDFDEGFEFDDGGD
jgi:hypothetical protein